MARFKPGEIRASSILPARRRNIDLTTGDGLRLVGEIAEPAERPTRATLVTLHPLPTHGGYMDSHVFRKASWRLPAMADIAVVRFNLRGVTSARGTSEGEFDHGQNEGFDVAAALEFADFNDLPNIWLVGWSFGTDLTLKYGLDPVVQGGILLSPPLRFSTPDDLSAWARDGRPLTALVPELDDYLQPPEAVERFAAVPQATVIPVEGARHLWVGEGYVHRVLSEIVRTVLPDHPHDLPTTWDGPMLYADDLRHPQGAQPSPNGTSTG